jgi:dihydroorotate dehydrogenase electron transfer subunit
LQQKDRLDVPHIVDIEDIVHECQDVKTYFFHYPYHARPGQFVMVWVPGVDEIPLSVSFINDNKGITVKFIGEATKAMDELSVGDRIGIRGPYGTFFEQNEIKKLLVVVGGIGIAPLAPAIEEYSGKGTEVTLALGAITASELLFVERLQDVCALNIATDDGSQGYHGFVSDLADGILKNEDFDGIYTCGPEVMMKKVVDSALKKNIPVWACLERYMKCGVGICDSCAMNNILVCKDGPVFPGERLISLGDFGLHRRDASGRRMQL